MRESREEVRLIARRLRPEALDDLGLTSALAALTNSFRGPAGLSIERRIGSPLPVLDADTELVLYRVAQEALTNVARHADCATGLLALRASGGFVVLEVVDPGRGFDVERGREGAGLGGCESAPCW